ncbi:MAG: hypothetical protein HeimC2_06240 [Candidatus Heimdallarchaeota archaeon LC_2]|nr:MAG: hypothetical protein HeimC2_06240 [Candidatus Heimdallarchaeota archaeon LC_2]
MDIGDFPLLIFGNHCPRTFDAIINELPIKSRGLKKSGKFIITTQIKTKMENEKSSFLEGDVSLDPSSGNISVHLTNNDISKNENYIGKIDDLDGFEKIKLGKGVVLSN